MCHRCHQAQCHVKERPKPPKPCPKPITVKCSCPAPPPPPKICSEVLVDEVCVDKFVCFKEVKDVLPCQPDQCSVAVLKFEFGTVPGQNNYLAFRIDGQLNERFQRHVCGTSIADVLTMYLETAEGKYVVVPFGYDIKQDAAFSLPFTGRGYILVKTAFLSQLWRKITESDCKEKQKKKIFESLLRQVAPVLLTVTQIVVKPCQAQ